MQIDMQMAAKNFRSLSKQEQEILREAADSPLLGILSKVFGQEFVESINSFSLRKPQRFQLAVRLRHPLDADRNMCINSTTRPFF